MTRRFVSIALAGVFTSIALVVWWASTRGAAPDRDEPAFAAGAMRPHTAPDVELDAESPTSTGVRRAGVERVAVDESFRPLAELQELAEPCPVAVRVHFVDAERRTLTGLSGTLELRSDVLRTQKQPNSVGYAEVRRDGSRDEYSLTGQTKVVEIPSSGEYSFESPPDASFKIECRANGYRRTNKSVSIPSNTARIEVEIGLVGQRSIDVSLRTPDGGSFLVALRKMAPDAEKLLRPQLDEHEPDLRGSGFVPFYTSRHESLDDAYWQTFAANTHASVTLTLFLNEVPIASERAPAGLAQLQVVVPLETVIDVISDRQSISGHDSGK